MRFLLVNTNNAVRKIFNITAKKAAIQLDVVSAISQIPLKEDYNCIFIDDGVLGSGDIGNFRNKMMMTKFCIILSKDSPVVGGFDSYIRKPFLPTDIYEVMKKEKNSDLNISQKNAQTPPINANSDIDLNEFSDSEDEFLSGPKDIIDFEMTPNLSASDKGADSAENEDLNEIKFTMDDDELKVDSAGAVDSARAGARAKNVAGAGAGAARAQTIDLKGDDIPMDSASVDFALKGEIPLDSAGDSINIAPNVARDSARDSAPNIASDSASKKVDIMEEAEAQINNIKALSDKGGNFFNSANDTHSIDFSAVMALQNEILQEEENKKKKKLIGGDIYTKKEAKPQTSADSTAQKVGADSQKPIADSTAQKVGADSQKTIADSQKPKPSATSTAQKPTSVRAEENADLMADDGDADFLKTLNALSEDKPVDSVDSAEFADDFSIDALDDLKGISDIQSDESPTPTAPKSANEILNNLDINNIDEVAESTAAQDFNDAFSQSINAEINSVSPNFNAKDFMSEIPQGASKYNMLGLPIDESGEIKDINDLSESELERLDDEALLLLQERALQEKSSKKVKAEKSPKILNKEQIDDINNILETTQGAGGTGDFGGELGNGAFAIKNNEFDSITQEALSEAINEQSVGDFGSDDFAHSVQDLDDFSDDSAMNSFAQDLEPEASENSFAQDLEPEESELPNFDSFGAQDEEFLAENFAKDAIAEEFEDFESQNLTQNLSQNLAQNLSQNPSQMAQNPSQNVAMDFNEDFDFDLPQNIAPKPHAPQQNTHQAPPIAQAPQIKNTQINIGDNLDLAEIIKTFPIDKLRDLLSGVQITINITFPTKKQ